MKHDESTAQPVLNGHFTCTVYTRLATSRLLYSCKRRSRETSGERHEKSFSDWLTKSPKREKRTLRKSRFIQAEKLKRNLKCQSNKSFYSNCWIKSKSTGTCMAVKMSFKNTVTVNRINRVNNSIISFKQGLGDRSKVWNSSKWYF